MGGGFTPAKALQMETKNEGLLSHIAKEDRYFLALLGGFLVSILLIFGDKAAPFVREAVTPAIIVYSLGAGLIAQIQMMIGERERLRKEASGETFQGSPAWVFRIACIAHCINFASLVAWLIWQ